MLNRILPALLLLFAVARAEDAADPARSMPSGAFAYAEFDADALTRGFNASDVLKAILADDFQNFFAPLREQLPLEELRTMKPVKDWVNGRAAVGLSAVTLHFRAFDGTYDKVRLAPGAPLDPRLANLGLRAMLVAEMNRRGPNVAPVIFEFEGVAVVDAGEQLRKWLDGFLENPPAKFEHSFVQRGARQILTLKFEPFEEDDFWMAPEFHIDLTGDRWIIATSADLLKQAVEANSAFATDARFAGPRARHTSGDRIGFAWVDMAQVYAMAKPLLAPVLQTSLDANGAGAVRNLAFGLSAVGGGIRESYGIGLAEDAGGVWKLLDAFPPGLRSIDRLHPSALGLIALKMDFKRFEARLREAADGLLPGTGDLIRREWSTALMADGINFDTELLPAFGAEKAVAFFPPGAPQPTLWLGVELGDEQAFGSLMAKLASQLGGAPLQLQRDEDGWKMNGMLPLRMVVHDGHLVGAGSPALLRRTLESWAAPEKTLAKDGEVFRTVMQHLNGGDTDSLIALAYGDIRHWLPPLMMVGATMRVFDGGPFNPKPMPDLNKLAGMFSGAAIGLRRDKEGLALDTFGPGSMSVALLMPWMLIARAAEVRVAEAVPLR